MQRHAASLTSGAGSSVGEIRFDRGARKFVSKGNRSCCYEGLDWMELDLDSSTNGVVLLRDLCGNFGFHTIRPYSKVGEMPSNPCIHFLCKSHTSGLR